ncbi:MAG: cyclase family protein [Chloroflexota bacterium]|nr:cyclase family protein [Chloroflexota bacterium]
MTRPTIAGKRVYDLTQPLSPRTPRSSDHPEVRFENLRWYSRNGVHTSTAYMSVHVGTHVDAPLLYFPEGPSIDQIPLEKLSGPAVFVDVRKDDWGEIGPADLEASPERIREGDIVVLRTGWHKHYGNEERYVLKAPGLTKDGFDWLVARKIRLIASDSPSPEHIFMRSRQWRELRPDVFGKVEVDPAKFPPSYGHKTMFRAGICLLEWLGGEIDEVPHRAELIALPLKYVGVEAAQAGVIALA